MTWKKEMNLRQAAEFIYRHYNEDGSIREGLRADDNPLTFCEGTLGKKLMEIYADAKIGNALKGESYQLDLKFGMEIYNLFNSGEYHISMRDAMNIDFWRYINVKYASYIVVDRWGDKKKDPLARSYLYLNIRRIYLSRLWWYIHLSWQGNERSTWEILKGNSSDTILNLVERTGRTGYRLDLYRKIMAKYANPGKGFEMNRTRLFRNIMKLNTAWIVNIDPELYAGGPDGYVNALFDYYRGGKDK